MGVSRQTDTTCGDVGKGEAMSRKYRPANGCEGMDFQAAYCDNCIHDDHVTGAYCDILNRAMIFYVDEPDYPSEWIYGEDGRPKCTAFERREP